MKSRRRWLTEQRGAVTIQMLLALPVMTFLTFAGFGIYAFVHRLIVLEVLKDVYLTHAQIDGGFTAGQWQSLNNDLVVWRFDPTLVSFTGSTPVGVVVPRGGTVSLNIGYPLGNALGVGSIINNPGTNLTQLKWARGTIVSEKRP